MSDKEMCPGMTFDERLDCQNKPLYQCTTCDRVARTKREHPVRSKATASHDKTMETLWTYAKERASQMSDTTISKTRYVFTVMHRTDDPPHHLRDALEEAEDGNAVGGELKLYTVPVPDPAVAMELQALGNDGEFFDADLETDLEDLA